MRDQVTYYLTENNKSIFITIMGDTIYANFENTDGALTGEVKKVYKDAKQAREVFNKLILSRTRNELISKSVTEFSKTGVDKTPDRLSISVKVADNMVTVHPLVIPKWFTNVSYRSKYNICIMDHEQNHIYIHDNIEMYGCIRVCVPSYRDKGFDLRYSGFVLHLKDSYTAQEFAKRLKSTVKSLNKKYVNNRKG